MAYAAPVPSAPPIVVPDNGATPAAKYTQTWLNPGFYQWTVPSGVTVIGVTLAGANGGYNICSGGTGGELSNQLMNVSSGITLDIYVANIGNSFVYGGWGYAYGGNGGTNGLNGASGGGGSSAVVNPITNQVIMAPGGGGGYNPNYTFSSGGGGGYGGGGNGNYGQGYGGSGGYGGGGNGAYGYNNCAGNHPGNGGFPGGVGYNGNGAPSGIIPGPGYSFVEIQWN